jgi:hypothetical protein
MRQLQRQMGQRRRVQLRRRPSERMGLYLVRLRTSMDPGGAAMGKQRSQFASPLTSRPVAFAVAGFGIVTFYSPSMTGNRPYSLGPHGTSQASKSVVRQVKASRGRHRREHPTHNPLVAGSSPARPTSELYYVG